MSMYGPGGAELRRASDRASERSCTVARERPHRSDPPGEASRLINQLLAALDDIETSPVTVLSYPPSWSPGSYAKQRFGGAALVHRVVATLGKRRRTAAGPASARVS